MGEPTEDVYRVYGGELSPYSVKVRAYFRYKQIPHRWILRTAKTEPEFQKLAKIPIIPLVVAPDGHTLQDSTPIIEHLEARFAEPSIHPPDPVASFASTLLEEFADEWGNKWMFHYRWARQADQFNGASRIARLMMPDATDDVHAGLTEQVRQRMTGRVWFVGSNEQTAPQIEASFKDTLDLLQAHLATRPYLFGGRPAFADFAMWGQVYSASLDPTPFAFIEQRPQVLEWTQRMLWARADGMFEPWASLQPTLGPLLTKQVGGLFVPWTLANAEAVAAGSETLTVELQGRTWTQKPQKYHAKTLNVLRDKYQALPDRDAVDPMLRETQCSPLFSA